MNPREKQDSAKPVSKFANADVDKKFESEIVSGLGELKKVVVEKQNTHVEQTLPLTNQHQIIKKFSPLENQSQIKKKTEPSWQGFFQGCFR